MSYLDLIFLILLVGLLLLGLCAGSLVRLTLLAEQYAQPVVVTVAVPYEPRTPPYIYTPYPAPTVTK